MTYALDTNILIYFFKQMGDVAQNLFAVPKSEVAIPSVVLFELEAGLALSTSPDRRRKQLASLLTWVRVLPFEEEAAQAAARVAADLKSTGKPIGPYDVLIAGTALSTGAILVTRNRREFQRVAGLTTVDWY
jgi:tRNA(fMet)-specific endonuclease VapC